MTIELFYVPDCPNHAPTVDTVAAVLREQGLPLEIIQVAVLNRAQAMALSFPGSPTVRVDGKDVEPGITEGSHDGLSCRTYLVNGKRQGVPGRDWIQQAVISATIGPTKNSANEQ